MSHRTTNPKTSFFGDGRETQSSYKRHAWPGRKKIYGAEKIWATEFPDVDWNDAGDAKQIYQDLRQAGWVYSSLYGWRYTGNVGDSVSITSTTKTIKGCASDPVAIFDPQCGDTGKVVRIWVSNPGSGHKKTHYTVALDSPNIGELDFLYDDLIFSKQRLAESSSAEAVTQ